MPSLFHRRDVVFINASSGIDVAASYTVNVLPTGAQSSAVSAATPITVRGGHAFKNGDKFILWRSGSAIADSFRAVSGTPTATSIAYSGSALSVANGDVLINLGPDTGTTSANWDGNAIPIYSDMGGVTAVSNAQLTTNSDGEFEYWTMSSEVWEVVRQGTTLFDIVQGVLFSPGSRVIDVTKFGAKGDGVTDDTKAIQSAINYAKTLGPSGNLGATVYFPSGRYSVSSSIVLPRTGSVPTNIVRIRGEQMDNTIIAGTSAFAADRGVIEWDNTEAIRALHQSIRDISILAPDVVGTYCVYFKVFGTPASGNDVVVQRIHISMRDVMLYGSNQYHSALAYFQGDVFDSEFVNVYGDPALGSWAYDTVTIKTDTAVYGEALFNENNGLNYCLLQSITAGYRRGGYCSPFRGRMLGCVMERTLVLGTRNDPCFSLTNSFSSVVHGYASEGNGDKPQILLTGSDENVFVGITIGAPTDGGSGVGNGIEFVNSDRNIIRNRCTEAGAQSFSALGTKALTLDANSSHNLIENFGINAALASEITDSGTTNYVETFNAETSTYEYSGYRFHHELKVNGDIDATGGYRQVIDEWYQTNVGAGQTLIDLTRDPGSAGVHANHWIGVRAGSVTGVSVFSSEARTAGTLTVEVYRNGGVATGLTAVLDGTNTTSKATTQAKGLTTFGALDRLIAKITTDGSWAPTTADIRVSIEVET